MQGEPAAMQGTVLRSTVPVSGVPRIITIKGGLLDQPNRILSRAGVM